MSSDKLFHKTKFRTAKELARAEAKKSPYETVEIICEGQKTEFGYFSSFIKYLRLNTANVTITTGKGSAPISINCQRKVVIGQQNGITSNPKRVARFS